MKNTIIMLTLLVGASALVSAETNAASFPGCTTGQTAIYSGSKYNAYCQDSAGNKLDRTEITNFFPKSTSGYTVDNKTSTYTCKGCTGTLYNCCTLSS